MAGKRDYEEILSDDAEDGGRLNASMRRQVETMKMLPSECLNQNPRVNVKVRFNNFGIEIAANKNIQPYVHIS